MGDVKVRPRSHEVTSVEVAQISKISNAKLSIKNLRVAFSGEETILELGMFYSLYEKNAKKMVLYFFLTSL